MERPTIPVVNDRDNRTGRDDGADPPSDATRRSARQREEADRESGEGHRSKGERPGNHRPRSSGGRSGDA